MIFAILFTRTFLTSSFNGQTYCRPSSYFFLGGGYLNQNITFKNKAVATSVRQHQSRIFFTYVILNPHPNAPPHKHQNNIGGSLPHHAYYAVTQTGVRIFVYAISILPIFILFPVSFFQIYSPPPFHTSFFLMSFLPFLTYSFSYIILSIQM